MKPVKILLALALLISVFTTISCNRRLNYQTKERLLLDHNWQFQMKGDSAWMPAIIPGCVHSDLYANKKIPDPFYRTNERNLQWIDKKNWNYKCEFQVDSQQLSFNQVTISFKGLDTYTAVKLNGHPILQTNNMFRNWKTDIKPFLKTGNNTIEIEFISPISVGLEKLSENGYPLPAVNDLSEIGELEDKKVSVFTRKAPYQYGWDWGPRFVTMGIWRPVQIVFSNEALIENAYFKQVEISSEKAKLEAIIEVDAPSSGNIKVKIENVIDNSSKPIESADYQVKQGLNFITLPITINNPELWWPNGMGDQTLNQFRVCLIKNDRIIDTLSQLIGLRSLKLKREPDAEGKSFYFEVNGKAVFAKGANYIPNDIFPDQVSADKYETIIKSAADANMNMLRVWGGGIYENDILYDLCDKYGLLIWQDFMFACSMYPGDIEFLKNVESEISDNVKRLRNHASIALWCGNNEIDGAWCQGNPDCGWGWKQKYTQQQQDEIWHNYDTLFHKIIPETINKLDDTRSYWPSSPTADWGVHSSYESGSGDVHYWGVWHGNEPFDAFYYRIGRFMSEYGFQSFPDLQTIKKFTLPEDRDINSEVMRWHQRSGYGNQRIIDYMTDLYPVPKEFEQIIYLSQVMQAEAIKQAINAHRAKKPYCMGTLYWQLNDCWPVASWSGMDYYGHWKALHYFAKKAYQPVTISFVPKSDSVLLYINNDSYQEKEVELKYSVIDFNGNELLNNSLKTKISADKSTLVVNLSKMNLRSRFKTEEIALVASINEHGKMIYEDNFYFEKPKSIKLPKTDLQYTLEQNGEKLTIYLKANKLVKNLYVSIPDLEIRFDDNFFDLLPGEKKTISCILPDKTTINSGSVKLISVNDIVNN